MASKPNNIFGKVKGKLAARQDAEGGESKVEIREDEDQHVKLQEIIDLLVAAGYFRARIKGLSSFDKIVGGMTWCIQSCNVDVDVNILFEENSTIGQKISLTEKIVAVLPKIQCPYQIEPHQIQGLDFIHIFPVIQWLVKKSLEVRQENSAFLQTHAVEQYHKDFGLPAVEQARLRVAENIKTVKEFYRPCRSYKQKNASQGDMRTRVQLTLLEYGHKSRIIQEKNEEVLENEVTENERLAEQEMQQLLSNMIKTEKDEFDYESLNEEQKKKISKHYETLHKQLKHGSEKTEVENECSIWEDRIDKLTASTSQVTEEGVSFEKKIEQDSLLIDQIIVKQKEFTGALNDLEKTMDTRKVKEVEELVILNDSFRAKEIQYKEQCKSELTELQNKIEEAKKNKTVVENVDELHKEIAEESEKLKQLRLDVAKKNRILSTLQRKLDEIPSRSELAQYQRRFLELYNQVSAKHKETKQYYTLYNTLEDTRLYMNKELSIMNSIFDNYPQAMGSSDNKIEFLVQLEKILDGVTQSKCKIEAKVGEEQQKRDSLSRTLQGLNEQQRKYVASVRQLTIECRKHEALLLKSNSKS